MPCDVPTELADLTVWGRFDDAQLGSAMLFDRPSRVLSADRPAQVGPLLAEVERAAAAGEWSFGYLAYEAAAGMSPELPTQPTDPQGPPLAWFAIGAGPRTVAAVGATSGEGASRAAPADRPPPTRWRPGWTRDQHAKAVDAIHDRIAAGEVYQCNLTDRLAATVEGDPLTFYAELVRAQDATHNAYLDLGRHVVASVSPELFFEWSGDRVRTRPMKGTTARGLTNSEDAERSAALRTSAKERAENLMIVDLLRNDLAKVAQVGGVTVTELFALERYPTVWQLTSEIVATLRPDVGLVDIVRALFPSGSVTGAPKRRAMALIRELEPRPRGVYCGAIGFVAPSDARCRARFNVAIRTVVVDRASGRAEYGAGGGITWDSDPPAEHAELRAKAAVLIDPPGDHRLIETMRGTPDDGVRNLERHLSRLADSAAYFGFRCDVDAVRRRLLDVARSATADSRVRLTLGRDGDVTIDVTPLPQDPGPVRLRVDDVAIDSASVWSRHKTTRRSAYDERAARHPDADDVVLVNDRGEVVETTIANVAARVSGVWHTPPLTSGCLPGVERGRLLELGRLHERSMTVADLRGATELAVLSSLRGWRPATLLH